MRAGLGGWLLLEPFIKPSMFQTVYKKDPRRLTGLLLFTRGS